MKWKNILLATVVIAVVHNALSWLTCGWLFNWMYTDVDPVYVWKAPEEMGVLGFFIAGFLFSFIFAWVYAFINKGIPGKGVMKGITYGTLIWLTGCFAVMVSLGLSTVIAPQVLIYWGIGGLVYKMIGGGILAYIYGE
jgi:uncharacterized membrane protein YagU involved in acid resistance